MLVIIIICIPISLGAQTADEWFAKGLDAFRWQKNADAAAFFGKAGEIDPGNDEYFLYLGICFHEIKRFEDAEEAYTGGIALSGPQKDSLLFRRGNLRWVRGNLEGALEDYTRVVDAGGSYTPSALLNRANLELVGEKHLAALEDYENYLVMEPNAPDRETIEKIIALLSEDIEAARSAEARRLAEEARKAEEQARREALMREVLDSLSDSGDDTTSVSAGTEDIRKEFEDSLLED